MPSVCRQTALPIAPFDWAATLRARRNATEALSFLSGLPRDGFRLAVIRSLLLRPSGTLRRRDLCSRGCAQPAPPPRPELCRRRRHRASSALRERACTAPKVGKMLNKGSELRLKLFVPMLSAAPREFKNRRRILWHSR